MDWERYTVELHALKAMPGAVKDCADEAAVQEFDDRFEMLIRELNTLQPDYQACREDAEALVEFYRVTQDAPAHAMEALKKAPLAVQAIQVMRVALSTLRLPLRADEDTSLGQTFVEFSQRYQGLIIKLDAPLPSRDELTA